MIRPTGVHVFGSRRDAFSRDEVLQENIIFSGIRQNRWHRSRTDTSLVISSSRGVRDREQGALVERYARERNRNRVPIRIPGGQELQLSPGKHNEVQKAIIEELAPRFAPGAHLLYLGEAARKNLFVDKKSLAELGIPITDHDKLPDVVLYDAERSRLFLVATVTSHGPVSPKQVIELEDMLSECSAGFVYVSAFPDFGELRKHLKTIT